MTIKTETEALEISFNVHNTSGRTVYLYEPDPPYLLPGLDDRLLILFGRLPVPEDHDVEVPETPGVAILRPGDLLHRRLNLRLPVEKKYPYPVFPLGTRATPTVLRKVQVAFGYVAGDLDMGIGYFGEQEVATPKISVTHQAFVLSPLFEIEVPAQAWNWPFHAPEAELNPSIQTQVSAKITSHSDLQAK
ncbi:hypothetical protein SCOR_26400 [Sulfidibacter corallicola]|uniref:Uncharacterized protein n=1 Tax=Sulfidibacter corallicola TaxID=2818388 RepID=A0A8A4TSN8_SULCO|nr:hypothetical protein [Sulfidibacter corallicola]QTD52072.1 hypothetical protein J3U87_06325 [Sulfidibacter corallicola]